MTVSKNVVFLEMQLDTLGIYFKPFRGICIDRLGDTTVFANNSGRKNTQPPATPQVLIYIGRGKTPRATGIHRLLEAHLEPPQLAEMPSVRVQSASNLYLYESTQSPPRPGRRVHLNALALEFSALLSPRKQLNQLVCFRSNHRLNDCVDKQINNKQGEGIIPFDVP